MVVVVLHLHRVVLVMLLLQLLVAVLTIVLLLHRHSVVVVYTIEFLLVAVELHIRVLVVTLGFRSHLHCITLFLVCPAWGLPALRGLHHGMSGPLIHHIVVLVLASSIGRDAPAALYVACLFLLTIACVVVMVVRDMAGVIREVAGWETLVGKTIWLAFTNAHCQLFYCQCNLVVKDVQLINDLFFYYVPH